MHTSRIAWCRERFTLSSWRRRRRPLGVKGECCWCAWCTIVRVRLTRGMATIVIGSRIGSNVGSSIVFLRVSGLTRFDSATTSIVSNRLSNTEFALFTKTWVGQSPRGRNFMYTFIRRVDTRAVTAVCLNLILIDSRHEQMKKVNVVMLMTFVVRLLSLLMKPTVPT